MDVEIVKRVLDRLQGELEQVWIDGYKAGVDATLQAMGQPGKYRGKPSTPSPEVRPTFNDDE